ncbi:hypothetical protein PRBEI_2001625800 [Prionailurus iriomotensis]
MTIIGVDNDNPEGFGSSASPNGKAPESGCSSRQVSLLTQNVSRSVLLEERDAKILNLQSQLLQKTEGLAAELWMLQEQRIYQLQTKHRETQADLEQKPSQRQPLRQYLVAGESAAGSMRQEMTQSLRSE